MRQYVRLALATAATASLTTGLLVLAPVSASAAPARHYDDFNGDGHRDIAYRHAYSGVVDSTGGWKGGAVVVVYGGARGLDTSRTQVVHQDSRGVPGVGEEDDQFGESLASADLNKDGYADLVVGNPSEHVGDHEYRGSVTILWGSATGLSGGTGLSVKSGAYGHFGRDVAIGDFTGDGSPDLAVLGGQEAWLYRGGFAESGTTGTVGKIDKTGAGWYSTAGLAAGKVNGDGKADLVILGLQASGTDWNVRAWFLKGTSTGLSSGTTKTLATGQNDFGTNAVIADFDKDGYGDIAVGEPDESGGKGAVNVWYGTSSGPGTRSAKFTQATTGVSGTPEADDNFGYDLSAADSNGDGYADLVVGVPHEDVDGMEDQGTVHVFRGGSGGLSGSRSSVVAQSVTGGSRDHESFGHALRLRDTNADGRADLAIGAASGGHVLPGASGGPTAGGSYELPDLGGSFLDD
ncbi:FG-GAP-like repeat-containing protein [Streptomyces macrosporus]|uniref:FG-GAP repeat protein n=1 Tax=Streptomyces macrosporus TaxID=44032 RepID=A0ABP5WLX6_9ACTN